jgi:DNA-directed RNA polymerase subunit RPC12/RpoP
MILAIPAVCANCGEEYRSVKSYAEVCAKYREDYPEYQKDYPTPVLVCDDCGNNILQKLRRPN